MEWQPIETAPKDGTEILTCNMRQSGSMRLIYWYRTENQWREKGIVIAHLQDTHWMRLPDKPHDGNPHSVTYSMDIEDFHRFRKEQEQ